MASTPTKTRSLYFVVWPSTIRTTSSPVFSIVRDAKRQTANASRPPIVMLIMGLLAAASVTDDRVNFTRWASPQNHLGAARGPIRFELVHRCGKWDKENRTSWSSAPALTCQDLSRKAELLSPKTKIQLKENNPSRLQLLGV